MWLLPTHKRPESLAKFCAAAIATHVSTSGLILINEEEMEQNAEIYAAIELPDNWHYFPMKSTGMGDKFREIWPVIINKDWIGWVVDDQTPVTDQWDVKMLEGLNGQNLISCNDGYRAPYRMCCPVFSGELLRAVGYIYPEGMWHTYADDLWETLGKVTATWWVNMEVLITHDDAFKTGKAPDETHKSSYSRNEEDKAVYEQWRINEMDDAVLRILELQKGAQNV